MKRFCSLLLAAALVMVLAGCGSGLERGASEADRESVTQEETGGAENTESGNEADSAASTDLADLLQPSLGAEETDTAALSGASSEESAALESAKSYLSLMPFSHDGLVEQLEYEGFTTEEATYAADNCGADWNEQAVRSAQQYLDLMAFSQEGLAEQLEFEGFTAEQAAYGAEQAYGSGTTDSASPAAGGGTAGQSNALAAAEQYLSIMAFSYTGLIDQLEYEGYSTEEATYAADHCGADWNEQAAKSAKQYLELMSFSRQELIDQLVYEGFTQEQATFGADQAGS